MPSRLTHPHYTASRRKSVISYIVGKFLLTCRDAVHSLRLSAATPCPTTHRKYPKKQKQQTKMRKVRFTNLTTTVVFTSTTPMFCNAIDHLGI